MALNRRELLKWMGGACSALALSKFVKAQARVHSNLPTRQSLQDIGFPTGSATRSSASGRTGDRNRLSKTATGTPATCTSRDQDQYLYHCETYGHPSKVGYKDLVNDWKAAKWDPEHLMSSTRRPAQSTSSAWAFTTITSTLWNSKYTRWNAVNMGPKKDIVGMWQKAAQNHGLRFGVSEHLWISYKWFSVSHGADKTGPLAGVRTTASIRKYADLYHDADCARSWTSWIGTTTIFPNRGSAITSTA
jgi:alpha-L-fucosidase